MITQEQRQFPVLVMMRHILRNHRFQGMLAVLVDPQFLIDNLRSHSAGRMGAFVVSNTGRRGSSQNSRNRHLRLRQ